MSAWTIATNTPTTSIALLVPSIWDFGLWAAVTAIMLLIASELVSPNYGKSRINIDRRRLRIAALVVALVFLTTVAYKIFEILTKH